MKLQISHGVLILFKTADINGVAILHVILMFVHNRQRMPRKKERLIDFFRIIARIYAAPPRLRLAGK